MRFFACPKNVNPHTLGAPKGFALSMPTATIECPRYWRDLTQVLRYEPESPTLHILEVIAENSCGLPGRGCLLGREDAMSMTISKSKFVAGAQCLKRLYWQLHEPELATQPVAADEAIIEQGREVGLLARQLFPGGVEVDGAGGLEAAIRTTRELITNPEVPAIFEGAFENGGVFVRVDILHRRKDNRWRLIEVKSTTDLKEQHLEDVAMSSSTLLWIANSFSTNVLRKWSRRIGKGPSSSAPRDMRLSWRN